MVSNKDTPNQLYTLSGLKERYQLKVLKRIWKLTWYATYDISADKVTMSRRLWV